MENGTNYIKIRTALIRTQSFGLTSKGVSQEFNDKLYDFEEQFRAQLILPINKVVGLHNWAIYFIQGSESPSVFLCDIYSDHKNHFPLIRNIVQERIKGDDFQFTYSGTVQDYLNI